MLTELKNKVDMLQATIAAQTATIETLQRLTYDQLYLKGPLGRYLQLEKSITPGMRGEELGWLWVQEQLGLAKEYESDGDEEALAFAKQRREGAKRLAEADFPNSANPTMSLWHMFEIACGTPLSHDINHDELADELLNMTFYNFSDEERDEVQRLLPDAFAIGFLMGVEDAYDELALDEDEDEDEDDDDDENVQP